MFSLHPSIIILLCTALLQPLTTLAAAAPPPNRRLTTPTPVGEGGGGGGGGRPINPSAEILLPSATQPYRPIRINEIEYLQSIAMPTFGITTAWLGVHPTWLRPVNTNTAVLLLNLVISTYASRPSNGIAGYGTIGPESSPSTLSGLDTRVIVKQWINTAGPDNATKIPSAPMRNKEIAAAAQIARWLYQMDWFGKREEAWLMCNLKMEVGGGLANCTGLLMVQKDLWDLDY
ncbi:MAG: hypothetical protein Q9197_001499 [Variospora fuerteventurae]